MLDSLLYYVYLYKYKLLSCHCHSNRHEIMIMIKFLRIDFVFHSQKIRAVKENIGHDSATLVIFSQYFFFLQIVYGIY